MRCMTFPVSRRASEFHIPGVVLALESTLAPGAEPFLKQALGNGLESLVAAGAGPLGLGHGNAAAGAMRVQLTGESLDPPQIVARIEH